MKYLILAVKNYTENDVVCSFVPTDSLTGDQLSKITCVLDMFSERQPDDGLWISLYEAELSLCEAMTIYKHANMFDEFEFIFVGMLDNDKYEQIMGAVPEEWFDMFLQRDYAGDDNASTIIRDIFEHGGSVWESQNLEVLK